MYKTAVLQQRVRPIVEWHI